MLRSTLLLIAALSGSAIGQKHGEGEEGTTMGPVSFLWPEDRPWSASQDNKGPCGSSSGAGSRTEFPISGGSVALSIADEAWNVAFRVSYNDDPSAQSQFQQMLVPSKVDKIEPGHQCYRVPTDLTKSVKEGTKATIQMEYWSNDSGKDESFFACADIKFVAPENFHGQIPCFNVTASEFDTPASTAAVSKPKETPAANTAASHDNGLTTGAKAGIAVGSILGASAILGLAVFFGLRRRRDATDAEAAQRQMAQRKAASIASA